jgi:histidine triad (HIT) family protein
VTIFQKIIDRQIPADIVYETEHVLAFRDINPQAPVHVLVIPKRPIATVADVYSADSQDMGHLMVATAEVARLEGVDQTGYRLVVNHGVNGGQTVDHMHVHVLGGRKLNWPPG